MEFRFTSELWRYRSDNAWHFITLPQTIADVIRAEGEPVRRGFGSVRVEVTIGDSTWTTSVFPDTESGSFVLPVKKPVRHAEHIEDGDEVAVVLRLA